MTDRGIVDDARQGGSGTEAKRAYSHPSVSVEDALAYVENNLKWRSFMARADQVAIALADEVLRLRNE